MPSHLTRQIFRRLLANEPIVYQGCLRRRQYSSLIRNGRNSRSLAAQQTNRISSYEQRRTFLNFNFFHRKERVEKDADMDPGLDKMMELAKRKRMRARMPPLEDVAKALQDFFTAKRAKQSPIPDNQAALVLQSLEYYLEESDKRLPELEVDETPREAQKVDSHPPTQETLLALLRAGAHAPFQPPNEVSETHVRLAELIYTRLSSMEQSASTTSAFANYVRTLALMGRTRKAMQAILNFEKSSPGLTRSGTSSDLAKDDAMELDAMEQESSAEAADIQQLTGQREDLDARNSMTAAWLAVLDGSVRAGDAAEVQLVLGAMKERGLARLARVSLIMVDFCIKQNDVANMRLWWNDYRAKDSFSRPAAAAIVLHHMLRWCLEHQELELGHNIVKDLLKQSPPKKFWDAIFVWAAGTGKGVDEIDRMMGVMEQTNRSNSIKQARKPDIRTINALIEFAVSRKDPYMAERFITLGQSRGIEPNARTYILQMVYRLSVEDVDGALIAYKSLQSMDASSNEDLPIVNKLIIALCKTHRHDFDTIMNVTADLSDRRARFEAATVSALALLHLRRDEHTDVIDLLNTHAYHYSTSERDSVRDTILSVALDPNVPIARAWNSYLIINDIFDETPRPQRTELMTSFMSRERADMGVRIFQQMRAHSRLDTMPTIDTYVAAFLGLAKIRELDSLEVVHNQLKLDYNVLPTTYLYNALMLAYTACRDADHGVNFWNDIVASKEGPSYNSIHIALRACEKTAFGDLRAREIWSLLRRRNVELDHSLWCSYLAALCGSGNVDQAFNAAEEAEAKGEVVVDAFLLGSLCDAAPKSPEKQAMVEEWALERYPEVWRKLQEEVGFETSTTGVKRYKVDRRVSP